MKYNIQWNYTLKITRQNDENQMHLFDGDKAENGNKTVSHLKA